MQYGLRHQDMTMRPVVAMLTTVYYNYLYLQQLIDDFLKTVGDVKPTLFQLMSCPRQSCYTLDELAAKYFLFICY